MPEIEEIIVEPPYVMEETRYNEIKEFMNGRDISSSYSDPAHNSSYDFQEFVYVWEKENAPVVVEEVLEPIVE
jgi:hypothetical protein